MSGFDIVCSFILFVYILFHCFDLRYFHTTVPPFVAAERKERQRGCFTANCLSVASFSGFLVVSD